MVLSCSLRTPFDMYVPSGETVYTTHYKLCCIPCAACDVRDMFAGAWLTPEIRLSKGVLNAGHEKAYKRNKLDSINCKTDTNVVKNMA